MQTKLKKAMENLRKEFTKETGISVKAIRQDYPGQKPYEDGFCDDYVLWLESRITKKRKEANEFIKSIAEMVGIDTDVVGFDGVTLSIDDFEEAIKSLRCKLKLFVWENIRRDYTAGIGFAMAHDIDEARQMIKEQSQDWEWEAYKGELMDEPKIYDKPYGTWISGGG